MQRDRKKGEESIMDELISRQEAIDLADAMWEATHDKNIHELWSKLIDLPPAQPEPRWIPVKWREPTEEEAKYYSYIADCEMPDDGQEILVTDGKYVWKDECGFDDGFYLDSCEDWQNITAWMPLPKPYERSEDEW